MWALISRDEAAPEGSAHWSGSGRRPGRWQAGRGAPFPVGGGGGRGSFFLGGGDLVIELTGSGWRRGRDLEAGTECAGCVLSE